MTPLLAFHDHIPYYEYIMLQKKSGTQRKRGRPATGQDPVSAIRLSPEMTSAIDSWASKTGTHSRSEAIRRLIEMALALKPTQGAHKGASRAHEMAGEEIDQAADASATDEQRASRKRRLLKGPKEFRDARRDHPETKS